MKVIAAESSGFCFGVKNAVNKAYKMIDDRQEGERLVMLAELTHNEGVVKELTDKGFEIFNSADEVPTNSTVIIRAHGVPPTEKEILLSKNCKVVDCTCPFVEKIHKIVKREAAQGNKIVLTGGKGHPEVVGICGEAPDSVTVISSEEELSNIEIDPEKTVFISQTTFSSKIFEKICANIENKIANNHIFDTICNTTDIRQSEAERISAMSDVMLVIGSSRSSNTNKLYDICLSQCVRTYLVSGIDEVDSLISQGLIKDEDIVGVTAGASTPEAIILEVVRRMDENKDYLSEDNAFAEAMKDIPQLRRNSSVKGAITSADADYVYVDVHDKSEGKIPLREFINNPDFDLEKAIAEHQEVTVIVKSIKNTENGKEIILSKSQVDYEKNKKLIEEAYESKTPVTATITSVVKDGVIANYSGVDIYVHRTQLGLGQAAELESYKGQKIELQITKVDTERNRLRVSGSHRVILAAERKAKSDEIWNNIEVGKKYTGIVRSIPVKDGKEFGAFVDIGGVDGLVHVSELSWQKNKKASDIVSVGQEIEVYVLKVDQEKKKISLGYKKEEDNPFYNLEERFPVDAVVKGTVARLTDFGAFINLEPELDALCHVSQISNTRLDKPSDVLSLGQEVIAKITEVIPEKKRISVSIKAVQPIDPEETLDYNVDAEGESEA